MLTGRWYWKEYKNYYQTNTNLYVEFKGKLYDELDIIENGERIEEKSIAQQGGLYLEVHPGYQRVINSQTRLEFSEGFNLLKRSLAHFYPIAQISWQHYLYL